MPNLDEDMENDDSLKINTEDTSINNENEELNKDVKEDTKKETTKGTSEKTFTQEDLDRILKQEKSRLERKYRKSEESKLQKSKELEQTLRIGLELSEEDDVLSKVKDFYKEQGVEIPNFEPTSNKKDQEVLGEYDAKGLIEDANFDEIQDRANELAEKKQKGKINSREEAEFMKLGEYLTNQLKVKELQEKGLEADILKEPKFIEFSKKFDSKVSVSEICEMYSKLNETKVEKPASTGSIKSNTTTDDGDYYTPEDVKRMSRNEVKKNYEKIRKSMASWK